MIFRGESEYDVEITSERVQENNDPLREVHESIQDPVQECIRQFFETYGIVVTLGKSFTKKVYIPEARISKKFQVKKYNQRESSQDDVLHLLESLKKSLACYPKNMITSVLKTVYIGEEIYNKTNKTRAVGFVLMKDMLWHLV